MVKQMAGTNPSLADSYLRITSFLVLALAGILVLFSISIIVLLLIGIVFVYPPFGFILLFFILIGYSVLKHRSP